MKTSSFSLFLPLIALSVSSVDAFAPFTSGRVSASPLVVQTKQQVGNNLFFASGGARRKHQQERRLRYEESTSDPSTEVSASIVRVSSSFENSSASNADGLKRFVSAPLTKAIFSSALFVFTDMLIKKMFKMKGISFPSSLAGCCLLAATLLSTPVHEKLYQILNPGAKLMQKFMMVFLVPNLIVLPLCGGNYSVAEMAKIMSIIFVGFLFSLLSTCYSVAAVSKLFGAKQPNNASAAATATEMAAVSSHAAETKSEPTPAPKAFSDELTYGTRILAAASGIAAIASNAVGSPATTSLLGLSMLTGTIHNFAFGARQSKKFCKVIHPLVSCTTLTWVWASLLGAATGGTFFSMLQNYRVGGGLSLATSGGGDLLTFVLGPAVVSLGVSIYERRQLIKKNLKEVVTATAVSCVGGLFGTAAAVRMLRLASAELRLSMLPRNITSALAVAIAEIVGANKSLAVAIAIVTGLIGANFGASILDVFGIKDPVTRGLGIGSAAHGLGTAAFVEEKDAFPFAAISMALTAICGTVLISVPSVKALTLKIALGGLA